MEVYDLSEENELDTYRSREVLVREGDEAQILTLEELGQGQEDNCDLIMDHIVPQVSSLKTLKMFDSLTKLFEGKNINWNMTFEKTVEECEDLECRDHTVIHYGALSNQRTNCCSRRRSGDSHLE